MHGLRGLRRVVPNVGAARLGAIDHLLDQSKRRQERKHKLILVPLDLIHVFFPINDRISLYPIQDDATHIKKPLNHIELRARLIVRVHLHRFPVVKPTLQVVSRLLLLASQIVIGQLLSVLLGLRLLLHVRVVGIQFVVDGLEVDLVEGVI